MGPRRSRQTVLAAATLLALVAADGGARAANDPRLQWESLETPHFRVNYYKSERAIAERIADHAEAIYGRMVPAIGWPPSQRVELSITDQTDSANAFASALPYDSIRFFATAPDDLSPLGDVDDWYEELVTHEFTHVLHTDHIRGIPAIANVILGKTFAPNQVQPRWLLEGLAVYEETSRTSGGRLRSSIWNMFMRADVLEHNFAPLDVFTGSVRRWPQGNLWYLYGSFFMRWIAETYGEDAIRSMIDDYSYQLIPYAVNRSIRRATGRTFEDLYPAWQATLARDFGAQADAIRARGLREGKRLTTGGQTAENPRFIPGKAWAGAAGDLLYFREDGHSTAGLYRIPLTHGVSGDVEAREKDRELLVRTSGSSQASFLPDGSLVFNSLDVYDNLFSYYDLFSLPAGVKSAVGLDGARTRLTEGFRATAPDVSPDGRRVAFVTNTNGTSYLQLADLGDGKLERVHALVPSEPFDQAFTPRWSPDNRHLAYSVWKAGGLRDVRIVDANDGSFVEVTHDRAIDGGPCFSPDGATLYFHSDRTGGVMNVYAYDLATKELAQVTNVVNGAMQPVVSADGKTLLYTGYTHDGFDVFGMALDKSRFLPALPYVETRPPPQPEPPHHEWTTKSYNPWLTMAPRRYSVNTAPGDYGQAFSFSVAASDIAAHHAISATVTVETQRPEVQFDLGYTMARLPFDWTTKAYRAIAPGGGYQVGSYKPPFVQESLGVTTGISYALPRAFDGQSFSVATNLSRIVSDLPVNATKLDPYETPHIPQTTVASLVQLGWSYSNAERFLWSPGAEKGWSASANVDLTHPTIGSDYRGFRAQAAVAGYLTMPWLRHHSLALHGSVGTSGGSFPGSPFYVGGYVDVPLSQTVQTLLQQGAFIQQGSVVLRGYPVAVEIGQSSALFNAEYRFPIFNLDRGLSTLPIMFNRLTGSAFVDYGSAFNDATTAKFKTGVGAELWGDFTVGYFVGFTMRLGYARGLASQGADKVYVVAAVPY